MGDPARLVEAANCGSFTAGDVADEADIEYDGVRLKVNEVDQGISQKCCFAMRTLVTSELPRI